MKLNTLCVVGALLISGVGAEDRKQRQRGRGRAPSRRAAAEQAGAEQPVPFWVSGIVGLGLGAAALPLSPVYAAIALGAAQAPGSRMLLSRAARTIRGKLGMAKSLPEGAEEGQVSVSKFARAINKGLVNVVEQLDEVPAFMLVDETGKPLKMTVSEDANDRFSFVYLEYADAKRELSGLRNPDGSEVSQLKVAGGKVVFIPSSSAVKDLAAMKADGQGTPSQGGGSEPSREKEPA
ncbi:hypothetical protein T492DRAFT_949920 [Pavlovales sp. CCMP2436]|nr:hypothetical protein T492DRAFT_949920 [Pavlovales sp. CCMP2436]